MSTEARPLVSHLSVVYLYVRDIGRSLAFYRDLLGIPLQGSGTAVEVVDPDGYRIALFQPPSA